MKACVPSYLALSLAIVFLLGSPRTVSAASATGTPETVLRVAYENKTQFPYYMGDTQKVMSEPGAAVELVMLLEERVPGLRIEFRRFPWKRCLAMLKAGKVDAIFNASFNTARLGIGEYPWKDGKVDSSRRLTTISYYLYAWPDAPIEWDGSAFANTDIEIGAPLGYSIIADLEGLGVMVAKARSSMQNLRLLAARRVDAVALQSVTADFLLEENASELVGIVRTEPALRTKPYYLMLSHQFKADNPELSEQIWDAVADLREERLEEIAQSYIAKKPNANGQSQPSVQ